MKLKFLKIITFFLALFVITIIYLSLIGIETEKFNSQIRDKIIKINNKLDLDLSKVKLTLDPLNFKLNAKTVGATIFHLKKPLELEYIKTQISLVSLIKNKIISSNLEIATKSILLRNLIQFIRSTNNKPELFLLEKIIKNGQVIFDLKLNFDENGNIKDDYKLKGLVNNGEITSVKYNNLEDLSFSFIVKKDNYEIKDIKFQTNQINFFSDRVDLKKEKDKFLVKGVIQNNESLISLNILKSFLSDLKDIDFKNTYFSSTNNFSLNIDRKFKFSNFVLNSKLYLDKVIYKKPNVIDDYFLDINKKIILKNNKLNLIYKNDLLSVNGEGEVKIKEKFEKINYLINKNRNNLNFSSNLSITNIDLKYKKILKNFFPKINSSINLKDHKLDINYDNNQLSVKGFGKIKLDKKFDQINYFINRSKDKINVSTDLILKETKFKIDDINYQKNDQVETKLTFNLDYKTNSEYQVKNFILKEKNKVIKIKNLFLSKENKIIKIDEANINYSDIENKKNKFNIKRVNNKYKIIGSKFNANSLIKKIIDNKSKKKLELFKNNVEVILDLENVYIDEKYFVNNLKGSLIIKNNKVDNLDLSAFFNNDKNPITFTINNDNEGNKITTLYSSKAKPLVNRYKFIKGFDEGYLDFFSKKNENTSVSKLKIFNFKLKELPALTKLLTLASLQGIADILSGEGIRFDEFEMNFKNEGELMTIDEIYAIGPAISILMSGYVNDKSLISLRGTLVPATTINKTISSIPFLGKILVGDKTGEGVFGVSFKIKGPPKNLETTVNPIKTLTPRFITRTLEKIKKN